MSILEHDAVKDLMQFLGIILILCLIWFFNGGRAKALQQRTNVVVTDSSGHVVQDLNRTGSYADRANDASQITSGVVSEPQKNPYLSDPQYKGITNKSPYFKVIRIAPPYGQGTTDVTREYITASYDTYGQIATDEPINITGWMLRSTQSGHQASIGTAVLLPSSYAATAVKGEDPIVMRPGDKAVISSAHSPIGNSFLINKCSGYFDDFREFYPYINASCPFLRNEKMPAAPNALNDACLDFVSSWPMCGNQINNLPEYLSHECQVWIADHATYNSCVSLHQPDKDFFSNEWRIFLNRTEPLWKIERENIQLLDSDGKVVDQISY